MTWLLCALLGAAILFPLSGCGGDDDDDDDDATADDDDATADDDDATGDDDDSAAEVASVALTADPAESETRAAIQLSYEVTYVGGEVSTDALLDSVDFSNVVDASPVEADLFISSVTAGTLDVTVTAGGVVSNALSLTFVATEVALGDLVINEFLADGTAGDANGDATPHVDEDAFVELVNISSVELSLEGATLVENELTALPRHTFTGNLLADHAVVVFGGGVPQAAPEGAEFVTVSNGDDFYLHLNPAGDSLTVVSAAGADVVSVAWGTVAGGSPDANIDQALNLDPDIEGTSYSPHSDVAGDAASLFSPGTRTDGSNFGSP